MKKGLLIAFCGIDGSGKTTQINKLTSNIEKVNKNKVYLTKQPTDWYRTDERLRGFFSGEIKESFLFMRELALFSAADKLRHYQTEIAPRLEEGCIVITDRYVFSAYSYFLGRGINDIEWLMQINKFLPMPDITFYIDLPVDTAIKRITERDGNINKKEEENITRLESVRKTFLSQPWGKLDNYKIIDGQKELEKKEQEILDIFNELLKKG